MKAALAGERPAEGVVGGSRPMPRTLFDALEGPRPVGVAPRPLATTEPVTLRKSAETASPLSRRETLFRHRVGRKEGREVFVPPSTGDVPKCFKCSKVGSKTQRFQIMEKIVHQSGVSSGPVATYQNLYLASHPLVFSFFIMPMNYLLQWK